MSRAKRYAKKQAKASNRRRQKAHEHLQRDHAQAQRAIEALEQALHAFGLPDDLVKGECHNCSDFWGERCPSSARIFRKINDLFDLCHIPKQRYHYLN